MSICFNPNALVLSFIIIIYFIIMGSHGFSILNGYVVLLSSFVKIQKKKRKQKENCRNKKKRIMIITFSQRPW